MTEATSTFKPVTGEALIDEVQPIYHFVAAIRLCAQAANANLEVGKIRDFDWFNLRVRESYALLELIEAYESTINQRLEALERSIIPPKVTSNTDRIPLFERAESHEYTRFEAVEYIIPMQLESGYSFIGLNFEDQLFVNPDPDVFSSVEEALKAGHKFLLEHEAQIT